MRKALQSSLNQVLWGQIQEAWREVCGRAADGKASSTGLRRKNPDVWVPLMGFCLVALFLVCLAASLF